MSACDGAGNCSVLSNAILATTSAAIQSGRVVAWGANAYGQTTVPGDLSDVVAIAGGGGHSVALKSDGTIVAWGANDNSGRITNQAIVPSGLSGVTAIAAGWYHTVALKNNGSVVTWGDDAYGQVSVPVGLSGVVAIAAGGGHTVALKNDGTVVAWGDASGATVPAGLSGVVAIAAGGGYTTALKSDGTVVAWGGNAVGQTAIPAGLNGVVKIASGTAHSAALRSDGTVVAWGYDYAGQAAVPIGLNGVVDVAVGNSHTIALQSNGTAVGWGYDYWGQATVPAGLSGLVDVAAGDHHSLAIILDPILDSVAPTIPAGLTARAISTTQINLSWSASTDNVGVTSYMIYRNAMQVGTSSTTSYSNTGLTAATRYTFTVAACDAAGNCSAQSAAISASTVDNIAPTAPTALNAVVISRSRINLTWAASTDSLGVAGYKIERCRGAGCTTFAQVGTSTSTSFSNTGLASRATYRYRVRAYDAAGNNSGYSNIVSGTTPM